MAHCYITALLIWLVSDSDNMEMLKIEQVIVGSEMVSSAEIKPEPASAALQPCKYKPHIFMHSMYDVLNLVGVITS